MDVAILAELTYEEVQALDRPRTIAVLPVGAIEAHGPHLPLETDVIIAEAMARAGAAELAGSGHSVVILPTLSYTAACFAAGFPGTISAPPSAVQELLEEMLRTLARQEFGVVAIANAHLDPVHLGSIRGALDRAESEALPVEVVFPDITRKPWALRLTDEFKSGACHAGRFEGSIVLAERGHLVRESVRRRLPDNPRSLSEAIREGKTSFEAAGGPEAYFGAPAEASVEEGLDSVETLGGILRDAVLEHIADPE